MRVFNNRLNWLPVLSLLMAALLWASSFIALKLAFRSYDPMFVIFGRMAVASVCFLFFLPRFLKSVDYRPGDMRYMLFMAFCEPCLYYIFEARAVVNTTASQMGMICATLPLIVAIVAWMFLKERISQRTIAGFIVAIVGACWLSISAESSQDAPHPALGNFYEFLAMVCAAGYITTCKYLTSRYSPFFLTAIQAFVGAFFFLPLALYPDLRLPSTFEPTAALSVVYLGAVVTLGAYGCYNYGVSKLPASQATAFINLIPVFTIILGWLILGETFNLMQYLAAATVFAGVIISQDSAGQKPARSEI
jgi:drug/metabolite transporter (DMT)-like permease